MSEFAELHEELRTVARSLLAGAQPEVAVDWRKLAQAGWLGLEVPEECDGAGVTFAETAVVAEELGRAVARSPFLGSVVLGVGIVRRLADAARREELLRDLASGELTTAVALGVDAGELVTVPAFRLESGPGGRRLSGSAAFVPDAGQAGTLLLVAAADDDVVLVEVRPGTDGLAVTEQPVLDATRSFATVTADAVTVDEAAVLRFADDGAAAVRAIADRAAVAVACDSLGISAAMLDTTVAYVGVRFQFGRAVGSFQAVKHACADMFVQLSMARQLVAQAVRAAAEGEPDAGTAAAMAASYADEAAVKIAGTAMQLHGGIGYTWESGIHAYLKRAALNRALFGSPAAHRAQLAQRYR